MYFCISPERKRPRSACNMPPLPTLEESYTWEHTIDHTMRTTPSTMAAPSAYHVGQLFHSCQLLEGGGAVQAVDHAQVGSVEEHHDEYATERPERGDVHAGRCAGQVDQQDGGSRGLEPQHRLQLGLCDQYGGTRAVQRKLVSGLSSPVGETPCI